MPAWKSVSLTLVGLLLVVTAALVGTGVLLRDFLIDLWWFENLGYGLYFWQRLLYRWLVFGAAVVLFFLLFFGNFWIGAKFLGAPGRAHAETDPPLRRIYQRFQKRSLLVYLPLALMLAVLVALPMFLKWEQSLFLLGPDAGIDDPVYGLDVSFYLFTLPVLALLYGELSAALLILLLGLALLYWMEHRAMPRDRGQMRRGARLHLSVVIGLIFVLAAGWLAGDALLLLYTDTHLPLFYGPGYEEMWVTLPLIGGALLLVLVIGAVVIRLFNSARGVWTLAAMTVLLVAVVGLRHTPFMIDAVHRFVVKPNELTRQAPFIANNIQATLAAYDLQDVETREYPLREPARDEVPPEVEIGLQNVPIWDDENLLPVYQELQEIRPYYTFDDVDIGRYEVDGVYQQVFLAARRLDLGALRESQQTWVNRWLKYTHGYGIVMTPAAQAADKPMDWYIQGIPPKSAPGVPVDQPAIYYGPGKHQPVIAPNASHEFDYASADEVNVTDYAGKGGVPVSSLFRKLLFALYFGEPNILYTTQTTDASRLLFRRDLHARIRKLTPFLILDPNPYLALADGRLYWIQDALTASDWYPYSRPYTAPRLGRVEQFDRRFNYIRQSVKVVVDAYDGSVSYYLTDPDDPIAAAYDFLYPGLFEPFDAMPQALKAHVRYPQSMFNVQLDVYARYHQRDPETFYNQEDAWELPTVHWADEIHHIESYYVMLNLIDEDQFEFSLFAPLTPLGQRNMRALAVMGSDDENYGRLVVYHFPKGSLVYGPAQVNAFIRQDAAITQELTLWSQEGSNVLRGRMLVVPVGGVVIYIQGIFLEAEAASRMPQLARIMVSQGRLVTMASNLEEGFRSLQDLVRNRHGDEPMEQLRPPDEPPDVTPDTANAAAD